MTVSGLVAVAAEAGLTVAVVHGQLVVKGPKRAVEGSRVVPARQAEVFVHLTAAVWDEGATLRRMEAADAAVGRHGCRGADTAVQGAAGRAAEAYRIKKWSH